jgi:hypothetical protein
MTDKELKLLDAIVRKCADCMGYERIRTQCVKDITDCAIEDCQLYPFRIEAVTSLIKGTQNVEH